MNSQKGIVGCLLLACTLQMSAQVKTYKYRVNFRDPLLLDKIRQFTPEPIRIISQGEYVARSLRDYLNRHPEMDARCDKGGNCRFLTTESENKFEESASIFLGRQDIKVKSIALE